MGTGSASFAGGGSAHASGPNAIFDNPGALSMGDDFQAEAGLMGFSGGLSPYFLFGSRGGENSAYALGYFYDARQGEARDSLPARQGMIAGVSWQAKSWIALGASLRCVGTGAGVGLDGFGIDEDAGALLKPWGPLRLGAAVRNLQESGVGHVPEGFRTRRSYLMSAGAAGKGIDLLGLAIHDPDAYYELRSVGPPLAGRMAHAFSAGAGFMPEGRLAFRGTLLLPESGTPGYAMGTFLDMPLGKRGSLLCGYTFQTGGVEASGEADASHSLSLRFRLGAKPLPLPLNVEVRADSAYRQPPDSASPARVDFRLSVIDRTHSHGPEENGSGGNGKPSRGDYKEWNGRAMSEGRIREWSLTIRAVGADGLAGPEVKTYRGRDLPPKIIRWEAVDAAGKRLPAGFYSFRLEAADTEGNHGATAWQMLEIGPALQDLKN
ncbi:MAG: hypothetical protein ABI036_12830 [Fibrobacteria bacterium]